MQSLSKKSQGIVLASVTVMAVGLGALLYISSRKQSKRKNIAPSSQITISDEELLHLFQQATGTSRSLSNLANGDKLLLYGLYKQATVGDVSEENEPSHLHVVQHAKYEAWLKFKGMPCEAAMRSYIQVVQEFENPTCKLEYETEPLDMFNAMGVRPSTLAGREEQEDDDTLSTSATPLQKAARDGNLNDLKLVLSEEDDTATTVNTADDSGQTALHFAADRGYCTVVQTLLEAGADPNAADLEGISVLQAAVIAGHANVAALLLKYGADPEQADMDGDTPISCARDDGSDEMKQLFRISSESVLLASPNKSEDSSEIWT